MKQKINKLKNSVVEIEGEIEAEVFESYFSKALKKLGDSVEIDGFRKGKAPENILLANIPESRILEEMAELALSEHYPKIITEEKVDAIGRPEINITKLARKNPLGFKIKTAVLPEIKLPEYKEIAKKTNAKNKGKEVVITDEEVENTITDIRKSRAPKKHMQEVAAEEIKKENTQTSETKDPVSDVENQLPELNDEFVQALGPFENVEDFKTKLKENLKLEKANLEREKNRLAIVEEIISSSEIDLPELLVEMELDKILYRMESDITAMGLKFEDYMKHMGKTVEDLRKEFRGEGEKKAKLALVLNKISEVEKLVAEMEEIEKEVAHILEHYKDADPERARAYAENVLTNEKIFQFLESQE